MERIQTEHWIHRYRTRKEIINEIRNLYKNEKWEEWKEKQRIIVNNLPPIRLRTSWMQVAEIHERREVYMRIHAIKNASRALHILTQLKKTYLNHK